MGKTLLQTGAAQLLQIGASFVWNWGKVLEIRTIIITTWASHEKFWCKIWSLLQVLQNRAIVTGWVITVYRRWCPQIKHCTQLKMLLYLGVIDKGTAVGRKSGTRWK